MEEEFQHVYHDGFTEHRRKWSKIQKFIAFSIFAIVAFLYTFVPFVILAPILTLMLRWYPRPILLIINRCIGTWLTATIVSAYCLTDVYGVLCSIILPHVILPEVANW